MNTPAKRPITVNALVVGTVFVALALRQHFFVDRYAVNVMFWDQWDFYMPLFEDGTLWDLFTRQHGPHRQGLGFLLTALLAEYSGWNSRWDAFGVSFVLIAAALLGLILARRCGAAGLGLIVIPLLFFNIRQYEIFVGAANISHGAMPIFLLLVLCLAWCIPSRVLRSGLIAVLTFVLIFTGFGLFAGLVVPVVLIFELLHCLRNKESGPAFMVLPALAAVALSWLLFAYGYRFDPAVQGFHFPHERPWEYLLFIASMINNFFGIRGHGVGNIAIGLVLAVLLGVLVVFHGRSLWLHGVEGQSRSVVIFILSSFALIYCCQTAVGRVALGWKEAAGSSRYVPLLIPVGLSLYLHLATWQKRLSPTLPCLLVALLLSLGTLQLHRADLRFINEYSSGRLAWKAAYLATGDMGKAGELSNFNIYPAMQLEQRLHFLEKHGLNLFNRQGIP